MEAPSRQHQLSTNLEPQQQHKEQLIRQVKLVLPTKHQDHHNFTKAEATKDQLINLEHQEIQEFINQVPQETWEHQELGHHHINHPHTNPIKEVTTIRAAPTVVDQVEVEFVNLNKDLVQAAAPLSSKEDLPKVTPTVMETKDDSVN